MSPSFNDFYVNITYPNHLDILADRLEKYGLVTFDQMLSLKQFINLAKMIGSVRKHIDSDEFGVTRVAQMDLHDKGSSYLGFTSRALFPHTDGSSVAEPATLVMLYCHKSAQEGGESLFVDGKEIYEILVSQMPNILEKLLAPRSVIFGGPDNPYNGSIFSKLLNGSFYIRFRYDHLGYFSSPVISILPSFLELINRLSFSFSLKENHGYIIQNGRWLHGRTAFRGEREMYRILVDAKSLITTYPRISFGFNPVS